MRKTFTLPVLFLITILLFPTCHADSYDVRIQINPYGPCQLIIVDTGGDVVLIYKPPDSVFSVKLASGEYFVYVEKEENGKLSVGYSKIMVPRDTEVNITLSPVNTLPREKVNIRLYDDVQRIRITTLSGHALFEILSPRVVEIPRIPLLIEVSTEEEFKHFFYDPAYSFKEFLKFVEEKALIATTGEKGSRSAPTVLEVEKAEYQSYNGLEKRELNIVSIAYWTSLVFLAALIIFIIARKIQFG